MKMNSSCYYRVVQLRTRARSVAWATDNGRKCSQSGKIQMCLRSISGQARLYDLGAWWRRGEGSYGALDSAKSCRQVEIGVCRWWVEMQPDFDADSQVSQVFVSTFITNPSSLFYGKGHIVYSGLHECVVLAYLTNSALCALLLRLFFRLDLSLTLSVKLIRYGDVRISWCVPPRQAPLGKLVAMRRKVKLCESFSTGQLCFVVFTPLIDLPYSLIQERNTRELTN